MLCVMRVRLCVLVCERVLVVVLSARRGILCEPTRHHTRRVCDRREQRWNACGAVVVVAFVFFLVVCVVFTVCSVICVCCVVLCRVVLRAVCCVFRACVRCALAVLDVACGTGPGGQLAERSKAPV